MQSVFKNISFLKLLFFVSIFFGLLFSLITTTPVGAANKPIVRDACYGIDNTYQTNYKSPYVTTNYMCLGKDISSELRFFQFVVNLPGVIKDASVSAVNGNNQRISFNNTGDDKTYVSIPSRGAGVYGQGMGYGALTPSSGCNKDKSNLITITAKGNGKSVTIPQINLCSFSSETRTLIPVDATGLTDDKGGVGNISSIIGEFGSVRDDPIAASEKYGLYQKEGIVSIKLSGTATQTDKDGSWYELKDGKLNIPSLKPGPYSLVFTYSDKLVAANSSVGDVSDQAADNLTFTQNNFTVRANEPFNLTPGGIQYKDSGNTVVVGPVTDNELDTKTSCVIDLTGWIICGIAQTIAKAMDGIYGLLASMMNVQPISVDFNDPNNALYNVWSQMRNIANVAFVISFLIIIFSQLTSVGVTNYGVKKLLPRLVLAAILVNVSYFIAAIGVDLSNIAGKGIYDILVDTAGDVNARIAFGWEGLIGALLGGALITGVAAGALVVTYAAAPTAVLWLALPLLLGVILAVFVAVFILAARQALIVILVVLSPLAFVAFLLPNTEKLFTLWRKSFTTMLVFFPIFAIIFGGSQVAGMLIIGTAGTSGDQGLLILLGMFTMVAPLIITPLLVRFSGGVIGQLAGMVNNKNKGLLDRTRKFSQGKADLAGKRSLRKPDTLNKFGKPTLLSRGRRIARRLDASQRNDQTMGKVYDNEAESIWANSEGGKKSLDALAKTGLQSEVDKNTAGIRLEGTAPLDLTMKVKSTKLELDAAKAKSNQMAIEATTNSGATHLGVLDPGTRVDFQNAQRALDVSEAATNSAKRIQQREFDETLAIGGRVATSAAGIDSQGIPRVVAQAVESERKAYETSVASYSVLLAQQGLVDSKGKPEVRDPITGTVTTAAIADTPGNGTLIGKAIDRSISLEEREAAGRAIVATGNIDSIAPYQDYLATALSTATAAGDTVEIQNVKALQKAYSATISSSPGKPVGLGAGEQAAMRTGDYMAPSAGTVSIVVDTATGTTRPPTVTELQTLSTVEAKGFSMDNLASMDKADIGRVIALARSGQLSAGRQTELKKTIAKTLTDVRWSGRIKPREKVLLESLKGIL